MTREIKFRAWNGELREWIWLSASAISRSSEDNNDPYRLELTSSSGTCVWMQYTGLKDKNGVEIYEGDILGWYWLPKLNKFYDHVAVEFRDGYFAVYGPGLNVNDYLVLGQYRPSEKIEVIGNIYENPELLSAGPATLPS